MKRIVHQMVRQLWKQRRWLVFAAAIIVFLAILEDVLEQDVMRFDQHAYNLLVLQLRNDTLTPVMEGFSNLATPVALLVMLLMIAAFAPGRRPGRCAVINLVCVLALNQVLKAIVQRPRPEGFRLVSEVGYSFPSGHSMVSMAFFGLCAWMVWHYERDRLAKWVYCIAFALVVAMVGISRVYLGVHYASDVLAGFCVSLAWLAVYTKVFCPMMLPEKEDASADNGDVPARTDGQQHAPTARRL